MCSFERKVKEDLSKLDVDVAEICSPPRVTEEAKKRGLRAGEAMDLITCWDF